ncbi:hypothetical protein [Burkholderia gladioli]|nr:hypothetical protein [Burkholderia gladioli]
MLVEADVDGMAAPVAAASHPRCAREGGPRPDNAEELLAAIR